MVRIYKSHGGFRWQVVIASKLCNEPSDRMLIHISRDQFPSRENALNHLLMVHARMLIFVNLAAVSSKKPSKTIKLEQVEDRLRWNVVDEKGVIDSSYNLFESAEETFENLLRVYTELTLFITSIAKSNIGDPP